MQKQVNQVKANYKKNQENNLNLELEFVVIIIFLQNVNSHSLCLSFAPFNWPKLITFIN